VTWTSPEPVAYFLTWTTYGSWLPGDERGWVEKPGRFREPDPSRENLAIHLMTESDCSLIPEQRQVVEETVQAHCEIRHWQLHIVNCRTQHVHAVISANVDPDRMLSELKAWCTRKLKEQARSISRDRSSERQNWWTEGGSKRPVFDDNGLESVIIYVRDCQ
jgi:hypothetical protein